MIKRLCKACSERIHANGNRKLNKDQAAKDFFHGAVASFQSIEVVGEQDKKEMLTLKTWIALVLEDHGFKAVEKELALVKAGLIL